jgi:hypothetical protein
MGRVFQDNLHTMLGWFLSPKSLGLEMDGDHAVQMVAQNIALGYARLEMAEPVTQETRITIPALDVTDYQDKDSQYLSPVVELGNYALEALQSDVEAFLLHGSLATLDYARGWSDFDTYIILTKETTLDSIALVALRQKLLSAYPYLLAIDPLQHHGFLCCSALDLDQYPGYYLPVEVLKLSKSFMDAKVLDIRTVDTSAQEIRGFFNRIQFYKQVTETGILKHHAYQGEYLLSDYRNAGNGLYQFKYLLNNVAITPSYYFGALGEPTYKGEAIEKIKGYLSAVSLATLEKVSYVRSAWQAREVFPYPTNQIPVWVQETIGKDYFRLVYEFMREVGYLLENKK